jgi:peptidoglycan hydrolase CwlO-like protein
MKAKFIYIHSFLLLFLIFSPVNSFAQLFGADDEDLAKIEFELKKFNTHLENLKNTQIKILQGQQEALLRQFEELKHEIEGIKQTIPQLQGAIEQSKSETLSHLGKTNLKISDLEAEVKNQVLNKIEQQNKNLELFRAEQKNLKDGLAQDIEIFEQSSRENFQTFAEANNETLGEVIQQLELQSATTKKGFDDTINLIRTEVLPTMVQENEKNRHLVLDGLTQADKNTRKTLEAFFVKNQEVNQKLREILQESLKQGLDTKSLLDSLKKGQGVTHVSLVGAGQDIAGNRSSLAEILKTLQAQNTTSNEVLANLGAGLEHVGEFNNIAVEKFNKLIDLSAELATHSSELESSLVGQLKESAQIDDARNSKVDLANEKLSRLIEILKVIAKGQEKLGPVAASLGNMQKEQATLQKAQAEIKKNQEEIKEALADLRRKANVNISRGDDIKKSLKKLSSAKK